MTTDKILDARFEAADRAARLGSHEPSLLALFAVSEGESLRRRRRRAFARAGVAGGLVIALSFGAPAATATIQEYLAQTGSYCSGSECGSNATSEELEAIDSGAPDFSNFVDSLFPTNLPLADGTSREDVVGQLLGNIEEVNAADALDGHGAGIHFTLGLSSSLEFIIYCGWVNQWVAADAEGDAESAQRAAQVMRDAAGWPGIVKTDGGGVVDQLLKHADAADHGDAAAMMVGDEPAGCVARDSELP